MYKKIVISFLLFVFIITSGFGCKIANKKTKDAMKPITLFKKLSLLSKDFLVYIY